MFVHANDSCCQPCLLLSPVLDGGLGSFALQFSNHLSLYKALHIKLIAAVRQQQEGTIQSKRDISAGNGKDAGSQHYKEAMV